MLNFSQKSFRWRRVSNGHRLERPKASEPERIFANGGREIPYSPFTHADNLYAIFARVRTSADLLSFVEKYGPLTSGGFDKVPRQPEDLPLELDFSTVTRGRKEDYFKLVDQAGNLAINYDLGGEEVDDDLEEADWFRRCLSNIERPTNLISLIRKKHPYFYLQAVPAYGPDSVLELRVMPGDLLQALRLQLIQKLSREIRSCPYCGEWFEVGAGIGRRSDARFCSDAHRVRYNSAKRSKGR